MRRLSLLGLGLAGVVTAGLVAQWAGAQEVSRRAPDPSLSALEKKLDQVLANQALILQRFDAVMDELRVVKVRCTQ